MQKIASLSIEPTAMVLERSSGSTDVGTHASTMDLYLTPDRTRGCIEWDIPSLETTEEIGLTFAFGELTDYDGVFQLPAEAVAFLRAQGFVIGPDFE